MAWFFVDRKTPATQALRYQISRRGAVVPALFSLEVVNVLTGTLRRQQVDGRRVGEFIRFIGALPLRYVDLPPKVVYQSIEELCNVHGLTSYDATYLYIAMNERLPLATLDEQLRSAAQRVGVLLLGKD